MAPKRNIYVFLARLRSMNVYTVPFGSDSNNYLEANNNPESPGATSSTSGISRHPVPIAGTIVAWGVNSRGSETFQLHKNGASVSSFSIGSEALVEILDANDQVSVSAGDYVEIYCSTGLGANTSGFIAIEPSSSMYYCVSFGGDFGSASFTHPCRAGDNAGSNSSDAITKAYCPVAGTLKAVAYSLFGYGGGEQFYVKKNGTTVTGGTITLSGSEGAASLNVAVAAGDYLEIEDSSCSNNFIANLAIEV